MKLRWIRDRISDGDLQAFLKEIDERAPGYLNHFRHRPDFHAEHRFFCLDGKKLVAYGYLGRHTSFGYVVDPDYAGKGIGTMMMRKIVDLAYTLGYSEIKSEVDYDNEKSEKMMRRAGFSMYGPIYQTYKDFRIPVLFITYNRLGYTKQALEALLQTRRPVKIYIWDNGSDDGTKEYLESMKDDPKIDHIHFNDYNSGINKAFNDFIRRYRDGDFIAKVDNDTIVEPAWLDKLLDVMIAKPELDALGAFMQRPPGQWDFQGWVDGAMRKENLQPPLQGYVAYNSYTGGTGVLIRTSVFWKHGLLFDKYPCKLGDWTTLQRLIFTNNNIAWYSGTVVKLLNIKKDGVQLNEDFPEYEAFLKKERDEGNEWYSKIGGAPGVANFIEQNGGREKLS
jgi:RimJ/RimL family protein N-acetyltransferase